MTVSGRRIATALFNFTAMLEHQVSKSKQFRTTRMPGGTTPSAKSQATGAPKSEQFKKPRFNYRKYLSPQQRQELIEFIRKYFPQRNKYIFYKLDHDEQHSKRRKAKWLTSSKYPLGDVEIIKAFVCASEKVYGCKFGLTSRFAVIDIDADSEYHNAEAVRQIGKLFADNFGLTNWTVYQSSLSSGWHLYLFFDKPVWCSDLHHGLKGLLVQQGFFVEPGTLEIFPNPGKKSGYGLRLPLQQGFAMLDQTSFKAIFKNESHWQRCKAFMAHANRHNSSALFTQTAGLSSYCGNLSSPVNNVTHRASPINEQIRPTSASSTQTTIALGVGSACQSDFPPASVRGQYNYCFVVVDEKTSTNGPAGRYSQYFGQYDDSRSRVINIFGGKRTRLPVGLKPADWLAGREYWERGLHGPSQRSHAIWCLSHYFFYGDPSRQIKPLGYRYASERELRIHQWLRNNHNGLSEQINNRDPDAFDQISRIVSWQPPQIRDNEVSPVVQTGPNNKANNYAVDYASSNWERANQDRKESAIKKLQKIVRSLQTIPSLRELRRLSGCAIETINKHRALWEPYLGSSLPSGEATAIENAANQTIGDDAQSKINKNIK